MPIVKAGETPKITVAIPTRNAGAPFRRLLDQVFAQETPRAYEVIALDSGSKDGTLELLAEYGVRIIHIPPQTFDWGELRDRLFEESRGGVVVNLSADAIPARADWLENIAKYFEDPEVGVVCGSSIPDPERPFPQFQWERNGLFYFTREIKKFVARYGKGMSFANTAVRRSVWEELRIDPQATGEDFGFQRKLHRAGVRILFPDDAPVLHHHFYSFKGAFRRCRNEGLALRQMGCNYHELDLLIDLLGPRKYIQWLREVKRGSLRNAAEWLFPVLRPIAVYWGSRFGRKMVWY